MNTDFQVISQIIEGNFGKTTLKSAVFAGPENFRNMLHSLMSSEASLDLCIARSSFAFTQRVSIVPGACLVYLMIAAATNLYPVAEVFSNLHISEWDAGMPDLSTLSIIGAADASLTIYKSQQLEQTLLAMGHKRSPVSPPNLFSLAPRRSIFGTASSVEQTDR